MFQILIVVAIVILDRVTKYYAITYLKDIGSIEIVKGIFSLTYVENRVLPLVYYKIRGGFYYFNHYH